MTLTYEDVLCAALPRFFNTLLTNSPGYKEEWSNSIPSAKFNIIPVKQIYLLSILFASGEFPIQQNISIYRRTYR